MPNCRLQDARDVLPKRLLTKLQKYCTGLVYVPAPPSDDGSRKTILKLHKAGCSTTYISRTTGVSARWVRHIVADAESNRPPRPIPKFCRVVPMDLVRQIQQHVVGRMYVPPRQTKKERRDRRIERLFDLGVSVSEAARKLKLSQRQVYRLKKAWSLKEPDGDTTPTKTQGCSVKSKPRTASRLCRSCGRPIVEKGASYCNICRNIVGETDGDVIVLSDMPIDFLGRSL